MASLFISHSSKDKEFVRRLAEDIRSLGHMVWLDEWEIKVGDCIPSKIEKGLDESEFIVVVLSENSVNSGWVEREWKSRYWDEVESSRVIVLPVLLERCEIPTLLKTKRYADFSKNYSVALVELMAGFSPTVPAKNSLTAERSVSAVASATADLIELVQTKALPLSQSLSKILKFSRENGLEELQELCRYELSGWPRDKSYKYIPRHRVAQVYASVGSEINLQFAGWGGKSSSIMAYIKTNPKEFIPTKMMFPESMSEIEAKRPPNPDDTIVSVRVMSGDLSPTASNPDVPIMIYAHGGTMSDMIESTRRKITQLLLEAIPESLETTVDG